MTKASCRQLPGRYPADDAVGKTGAGLVGDLHLAPAIPPGEPQELVAVQRLGHDPRTQVEALAQRLPAYPFSDVGLGAERRPVDRPGAAGLDPYRCHARRNPHRLRLRPQDAQSMVRGCLRCHAVAGDQVLRHEGLGRRSGRGDGIRDAAGGHDEREGHPGDTQRHGRKVGKLQRHRRVIGQLSPQGEDGGPPGMWRS